jgi:Fungalysin metallopeptidase (M36)
MKLKRGSFKRETAEFYGTPKEVWNFRTRAERGSAVNIARRFLRDNAALFKIDPSLDGLDQKVKVFRSLGATHVIFGQRHLEKRIHRAYVTVHIGPGGRVYFAKNRAVPEPLLPEDYTVTLDRDDAIQKAIRALPRSEHRTSVRTGLEQLWFPKEGTVRPAWKVRLARAQPRQDWIVYIDAITGARLSRYNNLALANGRARVFDPSPVTALGDHKLLLTPKKAVRHPPPVAYRNVELQGLKGNGTLAGEKVTTAPTARRVQRADHVFDIASHEHGFEEVMVYYHIDSAIRYLESLGYKGGRRIFSEPVRVNVNGTREDNSWYDPANRMLTFGTGAIDDAEDAETILHEFGHAIQDAICPDFGQSHEAAAMGEGFGDYFAASFFETRKPPRYRDSVMSWDGLLIGLANGDEPPCLRRLDEKLTFAKFVDEEDWEHENGQIWSATLWDIRNALGRDTADRVIIESHFQLDGFTRMARGARAIIDADRNLNGGANRAVLSRIFLKRQIGPL